MKQSCRFLLFVMLLLLGNSAFAAGDYILEEKFHNELAKAENGNVKSQYAVGEMLEKGRGTERDLKAAFKWYEKASKTGYAKAEYKMGMAYLNGKGVRRNHARAFEWLSKSANKGYVRAQYHLGTLYENGNGTTQDLDKALDWYKRALKGGYDAAESGMQRIAALKRQQAELATLQAETLARAQKKKAATARSVQTPPPPPPAPVKQTPAKVTPVTLSTQQRIMAGGWKARGKPAEFLPSAVTRCEELNTRLECLSKTLKRSITVADIEYQSKSMLYQFKEDGSFKVAYRNKVSKVTLTDEDFIASGRAAPVKTGWQGVEHKLDCRFTDDRHITCRKNNLRTINLQR